jgi:tRNA pseudouridine55 synthase
MKSAFLVIDKPAGITSHDVVAMVRAVTGVAKVGHTGTLDPFATGVLPLALGPATRLIQYLDESVKIYEAVIELGVLTDTGDPTGSVIEEQPVPTLTRVQVEESLATFKGTRMQEPPRHSAVKVKGKPLYAYARAGEDVRAAPRPIRIDGIELLDMGEDWLSVRIHCGRGTYARVLAEEIGVALGTVAHVRELRRTRSGPFEVKQALSLDDLAEMAAGRTDWDKVFQTTKGEDRVSWRPRDEVRESLAPRCLRPLDMLAHHGLAPVDEVLRAQVMAGGAPPPPPPTVEVGGTYLAVHGEDVLAVVKREELGPKVMCLLTPDANRRKGRGRRRRR